MTLIQIGTDAVLNSDAIDRIDFNYIHTQKGKGVIVAYVTQSPLCSRINLNKDDFDNSTNIFIGENIPRALTEELSSKLSNKETAYLSKQYELRRERGDVFFALIKTPKSAFIATMPPAGYYAAKLNSLLPSSQDSIIQSLESALGNAHAPSPPTESSASNLNSYPPSAPPSPVPQCPQCSSSQCSKNGKKRGTQYYKCRECRRQFSA